MATNVASQLQALVDDRFGPFSMFQQFRTAAPNPKWWIATCTIARAPTGNWFQPYPHTAAGASLNCGEATLRALAEGAERYSALQSVHFDDLLKLRLGDNQFFHKLPRCGSLGVVSDRLGDLDPDGLVSHASMIDARNGKTVPVPASCVHLGFTSSDEPIVAHPISTGLAFHVNAEAAIIAGVYENLERDALVLTWMYPHLARRIKIHARDCSPNFQERLRRCDESGLQVVLAKINVDLQSPIVVMCILQSEIYPFQVVGTGAAEDAERACAKAIDEAISIRTFCSVNAWRAAAMPSDHMPKSLEEHALLYAQPDRRLAFAPIASADEIEMRPLTSGDQSGDSLGIRLKKVVTGLDEAGFSVLWRDVTAPEIKPYGVVVRVVIPEALPLSQTYDARWLGTPRLQRLAAQFESDGYFPRHDPHPFS